MRRRSPKTIRLSQSDRHEIERLLGEGRTEQRVARRGRVLLAMQNPQTQVTAPGEQPSRLARHSDSARKDGHC